MNCLNSPHVHGFQFFGTEMKVFFLISPFFCESFWSAPMYSKGKSLWLTTRTLTSCVLVQCPEVWQVFHSLNFPNRSNTQVCVWAFNSALFFGTEQSILTSLHSLSFMHTVSFVKFQDEVEQQPSSRVSTLCWLFSASSLSLWGCAFDWIN